MALNLPFTLLTRPSRVTQVLDLCWFQNQIRKMIQWANTAICHQPCFYGCQNNIFKWKQDEVFSRASTQQQKLPQEGL